jgi:hypothetical protein
MLLPYIRILDFKAPEITGLAAMEKALSQIFFQTLFALLSVYIPAFSACFITGIFSAEGK